MRAALPGTLLGWILVLGGMAIVGAAVLAAAYWGWR